ncbi:response regulator [Candidatus Saccharibacteria bacterium]|nr:response regulator [Candidatus Saccharibacteria bacterium]
MKHILIIEDDKWLADSYRSTLEAGGYHVTAIQYAEAAFGILGSKPTDLILADMLLNTNTVLPLLHELQTYEDTQKIPVIVCTSLDSPDIDAKTLHYYGVVAVLNKTILTPEQLLISVQEMIL